MCFDTTASKLKRKGDQHQATAAAESSGSEEFPSFSANLKRGIFQCFGCGAKGNALEFAVLMTRNDPKDGIALRRIGLELQKRFCPDSEMRQGHAKHSAQEGGAGRAETRRGYRESTS